MIILTTKYNSTPFFWKLVIITLSGEVIVTQVFSQVGQDIAAIEYYIKRYEDIYLNQAGIECYVIDEDEYYKGKEGGDVRECNPKACFYPCGDKPFYKKKFCY